MENAQLAAQLRAIADQLDGKPAQQVAQGLAEPEIKPNWVRVRNPRGTFRDYPDPQFVSVAGARVDNLLAYASQAQAVWHCDNFDFRRIGGLLSPQVIGDRHSAMAKEPKNWPRILDELGHGEDYGDAAAVNQGAWLAGGKPDAEETPL